jgi:hypothetical protein
LLFIFHIPSRFLHAPTLKGRRPTLKLTGRRSTSEDSICRRATPDAAPVQVLVRLLLLLNVGF